MPNEIFAKIQKNATTALDSILATESKTALLVNGDKFVKFDFDGTGTVKVADILMDGLSDYYRANSKTSGAGYSNYNGAGHYDGYKVGAFRFKWTPYELNYDRGKQFQIDNMDNEEEAGLIIGNLFSEFVKTKVVPEVDATRLSIIAKNTFASLGNRVTETLSTTKGDAHEITHSFNNAFAWLTEHGVPEDSQIIYVSPSTWTTIANTEEIYKTLTQADYTSEKGVKFTYKAYMGRPIIVVPSDRFLDDIIVGSDGYYPAIGAHVLNYLVCSTKAVVPIVKLSTAKIFTPDVVQDFDGYKANYRIYHDCIIPKNKIVACYASVSATLANTVSSKLSVALEKGSVKDSFKLVNYFTNPAGMYGDVVMSATAFTLADSVTVDGTTIKPVSLGGDTMAKGTTTAYFALLDSTKTVIAASAGVTVPLKA